MFTGLTRQEQRTALALVGIVVLGLAVHQFHGQSQSADLVIDASTQEIVSDHTVAMTDGASAGVNPPLVDLNAASLTELTSLPGIGEVRAQAIIDHRTRCGPFSSVDTLIDVSGIGPATLERLRPLVTIEGDASEEVTAPLGPVPLGTTPSPSAVSETASLPPAVSSGSPQPVSTGRININTASLSELMTLPGIGEVIAQRIIDHRNAHGPFRGPRDLLEIQRIGPRTVSRLQPLIEF